VSGLPTTLPAAWAERWEHEPDRAQLHEPTSGWHTRGALDAASRAAAGRLYGLGIRKGDRVLLSATASVDLVVAHVACLRLGAIVVPVNGAYRRPEVAHVVTDATPRLAITDHPDWPGWLAAVDARVAVTTPDVPAAAAAAPSLDEVDAGDAALVGYTSGTTGTPKGAVLSHANLLAGAHAVVSAWQWTAADRLVLALPLFHMHGLGVGLHGTLLSGGSACLLGGFTPELVLDTAARHDATLFFGVPTMYARLADSPRVGELARLRLLVSGSAPLAAELHQRIRQLTGHAVLERYGMTETVMLTSNPYDGERRAGTVGLPLPGVELRLDAADPAGPGEVLVRGPNVFRGYWRRPDAGGFTPDGWFRTGDIGERDDAGYLRLVGRAKELIISGGYNVYPREVEDALASHPGVAEVAVAGTPDPEWGEVVTAYVVPAPGAPAPSVDDLRSHVAEELASYKQPRRVVTVAALPRNALGKVQRHLLHRPA
jgi:malonyl-CoA/methylmalonyl-CoA synthetase